MEELAPHHHLSCVRYSGACRRSTRLLTRGGLWSRPQRSHVLFFSHIYSQRLLTTFPSASTPRPQLWWAGSRFCLCSRNQTSTLAFVQFRPCPRGEQRWCLIRLLVRQIKGWLQLIRMEQRSRSALQTTTCWPANWSCCAIKVLLIHVCHPKICRFLLEKWKHNVIVVCLLIGK